MTERIFSRFRRITSSQLYFPEIDGIRFLAITLVVLFHTHGYVTQKAGAAFADHNADYPVLNYILENGDRGVELFFVLSGFILCLPFAQQYLSNGKVVSLKKYYLRRVTRLEPPYFLAITAIFLLQLVTHIYTPGVLVPHWLASLCYAHGIIYHHVPMVTVVAWSLEIEIQFYILAPLLFRLLRNPAPLRRGILVGLITALVLIQSRLNGTMLNIFGFGQYFLAGILLADLFVSGVGLQLARGTAAFWTAVVFLAGVVLLPIKKFQQGPDVLLASRMVLPYLIAAFYLLVMRNELLKKIFSFSAIPIIGGMCYSIYLLHYTIISMVGRLTLSVRLTPYYVPNLLVQMLLMGVPILVISSVFYLYVERPFMDGKWLDMLLKRNPQYRDNKS